ncbi:hypothetical protein RUND412_003172 [Rhizina undulata]
MNSSTVRDSEVSNNNNDLYYSGNTNANSGNTHSGNTTNTYSSNSTSTFFIQNAVINKDRGLKRDLQSMLGIENKLQDISKRLGDAERLEILTWLSEVDYKEHHKFISSARQANTGNWLVEKKAFIEWEKSSSIFWLHGIAGAGKTMLASMVIDMLMDRMPNNHALAYFYCKYGESEREEPRSILSTIVKQLSLMNPEGFLPKAVISLHQEQKKDGVKSRRLWLDQSTKLVLQLSKAFEQTVIVIDALDECNKETRCQLLDALKELRSSTEGLKIFITSRNDEDIRIGLEDESEVYIQRSDNSHDIKLFVVEEVDKYILKKRLLGGKVRDELKQTIVDTLINGAGGMFLWVRLQMEHIRLEKTEPAIREALTRLPKGLKATYSVIWDKIRDDPSTNNCRLAESTFKWILCAKSPLTVKEMINALSVTPMQWVKKPDHDCVTEMTILDVCQNLVVLDKQLGVFRTAHFSVTEFLLEKLDIKEAHTMAAEVCLTLLCCENHVKTSRQTETYTFNPSEPYYARVLYDAPTYDDALSTSNYVMKNWAEHIRLSGNGSKALAELQKMFFQPSPAYSKWLRVASHFNGLLESKDKKRQLNPLWVACYLRLWDIFKYLLRSTSNPDCTMRNIIGQTPILSVAQHGYSEGLRLLLEQKGVDLNAKSDPGWSPLHVAADKGHEAVVRLLLEQEGVELNVKNESGWTPLWIAAYRGHEAAARLLFEHKDVDLNAKNDDGETPLYVAVKMGHEAVVRVLVEQKGVDLNAKTNRGLTPLCIAANFGHEAVVRLLLEQEGVDLNAKNNDGLTARDISAFIGRVKVLALLDEVS